MIQPLPQAELKALKPPMSFLHWLHYYKNNQNHMDNIQWTIGESLSITELRAIERSIQQFQKGESSEGHNLMKYAKDFNNNDYIDTIRYFIREEQHHARVLGKFMELNGIARIKEHWVDSTFRRLRKLASLENSIIVLLTAEIISAVYYKALMAATGSQLLTQLCRQILEDEEMHINFQSFTLGQFYKKKNRFAQFISVNARAVLLAGTVAIVWFYHRPAFKAGGYTFPQFIRETAAEFRRADLMIRGKKEITIRPLATDLDSTSRSFPMLKQNHL